MNVEHREVLRGVNLGNWLLLEKWMRPRLFEGTSAVDEYTLCRSLGQAAEAVIRRHRETYITEADFQWLAARGLSAVRLPFGYWVLEADGPFVASPEHLDRAVDLAAQYGLKVVLDLHGLPGSQGPEHHTGRSDHFQWHLDPPCMARSLDLIEQVAQRYADRDAVVAFSVVNEPDPTIGRDVLVGFYEQAHDRVRRHMPADRVAFVIAAYPEGELATYHACLGDRPNVWTDLHLYQCFGEWNHMELLDYLAYPLQRQKKFAQHIERGPIIIGEWSMGIAPSISRKLDGMSSVMRRHAMAMLGRMQLAMYEQFGGWFFWSYRVDDRPAWCFRDCVERGWLPDQFGHVP